MTRQENPSKVRQDRTHRADQTDERTTHSSHEHVLRRTAIPTGLLLCRPRTGRRSNQIPGFRGTRSWGKRSSMKGRVQAHVRSRGAGQGGWSVCRTRSETGVKAVRAAGRTGATGSSAGRKHFCCHMGTPSFTICLLIQSHPVWKENSFSFLLFLAFGQIRLRPTLCLIFPEHLNRRT